MPDFEESKKLKCFLEGLCCFCNSSKDIFFVILVLICVTRVQMMQLAYAITYLSNTTILFTRFVMILQLALIGTLSYLLAPPHIYKYFVSFTSQQTQHAFKIMSCYFFQSKITNNKLLLFQLSCYCCSLDAVKNHCSYPQLLHHNDIYQLLK